MDLPKYLPADARRAATVEAVVALAAEQNPSEISTAAIAKHMAVTQGSLFRHFPNKEAIWQAVMEWVADRLLEGSAKAMATADSPVRALEAAFSAHVDFVAQNPGVPRMLFGELQRAGDTPAKRVVQTMIRRYAERLGQLLEDGKAQGTLAADLDARAASILFIGMIQGLVMQSLIAGDVQRIRKDAPGVFAVYRRALGGTP